MGKINKFANIYDKDGNLLRHVDEDGKLKNYTIPELEELVDKLAEDKDEEGHIKDPNALNNVYSVLQKEYQKNPSYLIDKINSLSKQKADGEATMVEKTTEEEVKDILVSTKEELVERETDYEPEQYVEYEEIKEAA